jgi:hypothetical protein
MLPLSGQSRPAFRPDPTLLHVFSDESIMRIYEFRIGESFWLFDEEFRCTDIGTRTVLGIKLEGITQVFKHQDGREEVIGHLTKEEAITMGYYSGPPYGCIERYFDEADLPACAYDPEGNGQHSDLGFGRWVRVGEGAARHVEWRPAPRRRESKRPAEKLEPSISPPCRRVPCR